MEEHLEHQELSEVSRRLEKSLSIDAERKMEKYSRLISAGKAVAKEGDIQKALDLFKQAFNIHQSPKLESRIKKIEELLAENDLEDEDDEFVNVRNSGLMLFKELHEKLYDYQIDGVSFLYGLYRDGRKGGVLADDMGLGKTIQIISFLSGMYDSELIRHTLLIMPTSLITNWTKEFSKWTPGMRVKDFHGASKAERTRNLEKVQSRGGVIITTYTMLINNWQQLASYRGKEFCWDYMILDEAHKIKNSSTKTAKSAYAIPSKNRVLLTGTPVQNNLREMWTLFDFACQGSLLGTAKTFKTEYENPITRAREKDATPGEKALGSRMSENLMTLIKPYFLRRTKSEVQKKKSGGKEAQSEPDNHQDPQDQAVSGAVMPKLTRKNDLIVWTYLSPVQEDIYRQFIGLDHIKELLMKQKSPLAELNILKKLCDHPRLLSANAIAKLGLDENPDCENSEADAHSIANVSDETLISESGKLVFLLALLERLRVEGHRTLVFAHYRVVLDILERILGNRGFKVLKLDGRIKKIPEREKMISIFKKNKRYSVFLLTTQVGGVGINVTAANRVVIYDPSWNPATDAQAVDRAYRIGQTENVVIYRLITCGTVEEKIYRRQVFKDSLIRQNTGDKKNPFRYFSRQELKELFTLEDPRSSTTQLQLQNLHSRHRRTDPALDEHIAQLHAMHMFGISDHDLMFSLDVNHDEDPEDQEAYQYIEGRVQKAQDLVKAESELQMPLSTDPAWLRQSLNIRGDPNRKNPKHLKPSNPQTVSNLMMPAAVESDPSGPGTNEPQQDMGDQAIDLSSNASPVKHSADVGELMERSSGSDDYNNDGLNRTCHSETGLDRLLEPDFSFKAETSTEGPELETSHGNFVVQLEDSDEVQEEEEEQKLLSPLSERRPNQINHSRDADMDECTKDLSWTIKKQTAGDDYNVDKDEDEEQQIMSLQDISFQVLGASTPKSAPEMFLETPETKCGDEEEDVAPGKSSLDNIFILDKEEEEEEDEEDSEDDADDEIKTSESNSEGKQEGGNDSSQLRLDEASREEEEDKSEEEFELDSEEDEAKEMKVDKTLDEDSEEEEVKEYQDLENKEQLEQEVSDKGKVEGESRVEEVEEITKEEVQENDPEEKAQDEVSKEEEGSEETRMGEAETQGWESRNVSVHLEEESEQGENQEAELDESEAGLEEERQENKSGEEDYQEEKFEAEVSEEEEEESALITTSPNFQMKPADNPACKTEPTGQSEPPENNSRQKKLDPSPPQQNNRFNTAEVDQPGSGAEELSLNLSEQLVVLTLNASAEAGDLMVQTSGLDPDLLLITAEDSSGLNRTSHSETGLDRLQEPDFSFKAETSREGAELETSHGNFVLRWEDSDDVQEEEEDEREEQELESELQNRDDYDGRRSLLEGLQALSISSSHESMDEHQEEMPHINSPTEGSFQVFGLSTPEPDSSGSSSHNLRGSTGESSSVVPHSSIVWSTKNIDPQDFQEEDKDRKCEDAPGRNHQSEETQGEEEDAVDKSSLEEEEEEVHDDADNEMETDRNKAGDISEGGEDDDVTDSSPDELQLDGGEEFEKQEKDAEEEEIREEAQVQGDAQKEETQEDMPEKDESQEDETWDWKFEEAKKWLEEQIQEGKEDAPQEENAQEEPDGKKEPEEVCKKKESEEEEEMEEETQDWESKDTEKDQSGEEEMMDSFKSTLIGSSPNFPKMQLGENLELSPEEAGRRPEPGRETSQESQNQSPPERDDQLNTEEKDVDQSSSGGKEPQQNPTDQDIHQSCASCQEDSTDAGKLMDESSGSGSKLLQMAAHDSSGFFISTSQSEMDLDLLSPPHCPPSESTFTVDTSRLSADLHLLQQNDLYYTLENEETDEEPAVTTKKLGAPLTDGSSEEHQKRNAPSSCHVVGYFTPKPEPSGGSPPTRSGLSQHSLLQIIITDTQEVQDRCPVKKDDEDLEKNNLPLTHKELLVEGSAQEKVCGGAEEDDAVGFSQNMMFVLEEEKQEEDNGANEKETNKDAEISERSSERRQGEGSSHLELQLHGSSGKEDELKEKEEIQEAMKGNDTQEEVSEQEETQAVHTQESKSGEEDEEEMDMSQSESDEKERQKDELHMEEFDEKEEEKIQQEVFEKETKQEIQERVSEQEEKEERELKLKEFNEHDMQDKEFEEPEELMIQKELKENDTKNEETQDWESRRDIEDNDTDEKQTDKDAEISGWSSEKKQREGFQRVQLHGSSEEEEVLNEEEKIQEELKGNHTQEEVSDQEGTREVQTQESKSGEDMHVDMSQKNKSGKETQERELKIKKLRKDQMGEKESERETGEETQEVQTQESKSREEEEMQVEETQEEESEKKEMQEGKLQIQEFRDDQMGKKEFDEKEERDKEEIQEKMEENYIIEEETKKGETRGLEWEEKFEEEVTDGETEEGESEEQEGIQRKVQGKETQEESDKEMQEEELHMKDHQSTVLPSHERKTLDVEPEEDQEETQQEETGEDECGEKGMQEEEAQEKETEKQVTQEQELQVEKSERMQEVETQEEENEEEKMQENQAQVEESDERETEEEALEEEKSEDMAMENEGTLGEKSNEELKEEEKEEVFEKVDVQKDEAKMEESEEPQKDVSKEPESEKESKKHKSNRGRWREEESDYEKMEVLVEDINHLQNNLHQSESSLRAETPRVNATLDSSDRNFVLQLEDTTEDLQDTETEEEEQKLLSELQRNSSFDVEKSLAERLTFNSCNVSHLDNSIITTEKKRASVNRQQDEDEELLMKSLFTKSLPVHAASTPKSGASVSSPPITKSSSGRKAWVSFRRSLLQFILEYADDQEVEANGFDVDGDVSGLNSEEEEESVAFLTCNESQLEETTRKSQAREDDERDAVYTSVEDMELLAEKEERKEKKEMEPEDRGSETSEAIEEDVLCSAQDEKTNKEEEEVYEESAEGREL